ncbi:hypothetical protein [Minwuia thermotolerans]|uniref:DUF945 domain-containing protein n=1 Tax=Minwuia thermotolerans TaxID=2056226 RepID=A0A2M9FXA2_9PROT|nr:hypothetical protein [Minwuia thermotolerans]PJK28069.1 hypothetical protein CVT23_18700 [Minwuia thermotolerans]
MKRFLVLGVIVAAVAAAGVWFGLPLYAEEQFRSALDSYGAGRGDDRVSHEDARVDYWNDRATLARFTDRLDLPLPGGRSAPLLVSFEDVEIRDYDLGALDAALAGNGSPEQPLVERLSWQRISVARASDGVVVLTGGAGALERVSAARLAPPVLVNAAGLEVAGFVQKDLALDLTSEGFVATGRLKSVMLEGATAGSVARAETGSLEMRLWARHPDWERSIDASVISGRLAVGDIAYGAEGVVSFAEVAHEGFLVDYDLPPAASGEAAGDEAEAPLKGQVGYESYEIAGGRFDPMSFALYPAMLRAAPQEDAPRDREALAALVELAVTVLERAVRLETGMERAVMRGVLVDLGDLQKQSIASVEIGPLRGLKLETAVMLDQTQVDRFGNRSTVARSVVSGIDLSALPAYLRRVLGDPVTLEKLDAAGGYYREASIAEAVPPFDLGRWLVEDQRIQLANGGEVTVARYEQSAFRADAEGRVDFAFAVDGMTVGLEDVATVRPASRPLIETLRAEGFERLDLDMGFDLGIDLAGGVIDLRRLGLSADRLAETGFSARLSELDFEAMRNQPEAQRNAQMMQGALSGLRFRLADGGARRIAFRMMGGSDPESAAQVREGLAAQAAQMGLAFGTPRTARIGEAVAAFLREGGALQIGTDAEAPVPILELMILSQRDGPGAAAEALELEASHTAPE